MKYYTPLFVMGSILGLTAFGYASPQPSTHGYVVIQTSRNVEAIDYQHRGGASKVDMAGTALLPSAEGEAKVRSKRGTMEVEAEFGNLQSPTTFGAEYLTYVLWAISPDGHAANLGEVLIGGNYRSKLTATTSFQSFALIVTAEPYFAVRQPSNVVVLENVVRADTKGTTEAVTSKYELMERGGYIPTGYKFDPVVLDAKLPLEFLEARNAVRIAQSEGAELYASESYAHAVQLMNTADAYATRGHSDKKQLIAKSRQTVQTAEDAREIAVKEIDKNNRADERQASANAQARTQAQADEATRQKEQAQSDAARSKAKAMTAQLNAAAAQADAANSQAELARNQDASAAAITLEEEEMAAAITRLRPTPTNPERWQSERSRMNPGRSAIERNCVRNCQYNSTRSSRHATARGDLSSACLM